MSEIHTRCAELSLEHRTLYLPNARCEVRGMPHLHQGTYTLAYHQVPGFTPQTPHNTERRLPEDVTAVVYHPVGDRSDRPVLLPFHASEPGTE